jgi:O-antigen/teichoic acid export membrane protein
VPKIKINNNFFRTFSDRLLSGFSWNLLSTIALQGSTLLSSIIVARILGITSFGTYATLITTIMTIATIAQGCNGLAATKYVAENLVLAPERVAIFTRILSIFSIFSGLCSSGIIFILAHPLGEMLLGNSELELQIRLVAFAVFFQIYFSYQMGTLQGFGAFKELGLGSLWCGLVQILFSVSGALLNQIDGSLVGFALACGIRCGILYYIIGRVRSIHHVPNQVIIKFDDFKVLWQFAFPASLAGFFTMPCIWLVTVMVARQSDGSNMVAVFFAANQIRLSVLRIPMLLNSVSFRVLSDLKGLKDHVSFHDVFRSNIAFNLVFSIIFVGILIVLAHPLLGLYGQEFQKGYWVLIVLIFSVLIETMAVTLYQLMSSAGRMWQSLVFVVIPRDLVYLGLTALLLPSLGVLGASLAYVAAWLLALIVIILLIRPLFINSNRFHESI